MKRLPSEMDINPVPGSSEEEQAIKHFHRKSFEEAKLLFMEGCFDFQGDLMWMGTNAWLFYFPAAIAALRRPGAQGLDWDLAETLVSVAESRLDNESGELLRPAFPLLRELCGLVIAESEREADAGASSLALKLRCSVLLRRVSP